MLFNNSTYQIILLIKDKFTLKQTSEEKRENSQAYIKRREILKLKYFQITLIPIIHLYQAI